MRFCLSIALTLLTTVPLVGDEENSSTIKLETSKEKASYGVGLDIGRQFKEGKMDLDPQLVAAGIAAVLAGDEPLISKEEISKAFAELRETAMAKAKKEGTDFLKLNATKKGVITTKSGLQYLVLKEGKGESPKTTDSVSAHYRGKLLDGTVFDESYKGENPTAEEPTRSFPLNRVIKGWTEGVPLMKVGAKHRLFIPSDLAYGAPGRPGIPPHSVLIFDLELVAIDGE